jgi:hypothetical protein
VPLPVVPIFLSAEQLDVHHARSQLQGHTSKFLLFKSIDCDVLLQDDMHSVRHEQAILDRGETLLYQCGHLREEAWNVENDAAANEVEAVGVDKSTGQEVEAVGYAIGDDGVTGIVTSSSTSAKLCVRGKDVGQLSLLYNGTSLEIRRVAAMIERRVCRVRIAREYIRPHRPIEHQE